MKKSTYESDKRKEELFAEWLDKYFYARIQNYYENIYRITNKNTQKRGIDVVIKSFDGSELKVDEKATLDYINKNIPTFAFEVKNRTSGREGWLYNKSLETDYYLLAWPNSECDYINEADDFSSASIMTIRRERVKELLNKRNLDENEIMRRVKAYQDRLNEGNKFSVCDGINIYFNETKYEKPINIVIHNKILKQYMNALYYVDKKEIKEIEKEINLNEKNSL